eukprot:3307988-Rhodomonas_salina.1
MRMRAVAMRSRGCVSCRYIRASCQGKHVYVTHSCMVSMSTRACFGFTYGADGCAYGGMAGASIRCSIRVSTSLQCTPSTR